MKFLAAALLASLISTAALAQQGGGVVYVPPITATHCAEWKSANVLEDSGGTCGGGGGGGVTSFNTRTGAVTLTSGDVTTALGYTPLSPANNLSDLASAATARTNLGLGTAATHAATDFLLAANNLSDLASAATARTNLGLGSLATLSSINNSNWSGTGLALANLASQAANTVLANATSGSTTPTAFAMPSCSGASNALIWTTSTGFGCNTISGGSGNALFGTTTGNVANNFVTMANTTVGVQDSGTSWAVPGSIGSTTPNAGAFSTLSATGNLTTNVTGSTQCLHVSTVGLVSGTGSDCAAAGGNTTISPATGNVAGDIVTMSNTTTTIKDSNGNITQAAWTTSGVQADVPAVTLTDSTSTGTVAAIYNNKIGGSTIATPTNAVTCTVCATLDVEPPVAGTHLTFTAAYAARFGGNIISSGNYYAVATNGCGSGQPGYSFAGSTNTGLDSNGGFIGFCVSGSLVGQAGAGGVIGGGGGALGVGSVSATVPSVLVNNSNTGTGLGASGAGNVVDVITSSVDMWRTSSGHVYDIGGATAAANETGYLCFNSGSTPANELLLDTVTCLVSLAKFKTIDAPMRGSDELAELMKLKPVWGWWNQKTHPTSDIGEQPFLIAENVAEVDPRLAAYTSKGELKGVRYDTMSAFLVAAIQEQQREIDQLRGYQ